MKPTPHKPANPAAVRVLSLADFDQVSSLFVNWQGRFEQLSPGPFASTLQIVRGGQTQLIRIEANQRVLLRGHDEAGLVSVHPVTAANAAAAWQGRRLSPGQLVVRGTGVEIDHCSNRQTENLGLFLRHEVMVQAARSFLNSDVPVYLSNWLALSPPPDLFAELNRQFTRLLNASLADPTLPGTPECHRFEQECLRAILACLVPADVAPAVLSLPARSRLTRTAEEFMRSHLREPVGTIDLCRELAVSDRTLRLAFQERYGLGPMVYFKHLRLNAVRHALKTNPVLGVAEVARGHGFHHLGNFAADYRRLFGELPSATQRRCSSH